MILEVYQTALLSPTRLYTPTTGEEKDEGGTKGDNIICIALIWTPVHTYLNIVTVKATIMTLHNTRHVAIGTTSATTYTIELYREKNVENTHSRTRTHTQREGTCFTGEDLRPAVIFPS